MEQSNFIDSKYTRWYFAIIETAKSSTYEGYTETHHIIPRSLGGNNAKENIVKITARQHFICHLLLVKMTEGQARFKMICAAHHMSVCHRKELYKITSITYERLKRERSESMKGNTLWKNIKWTPEQRKNVSEGLRKSKAFEACHNDEWRRKLSDFQSRGVVLINSLTGEVFGEWRNCTDVANHFGCTRANVKWAVRKGTCIGRKLKSLNYTPHYVKWKTSFTEESFHQDHKMQPQPTSLQLQAQTDHDNNTITD